MVHEQFPTPTGKPSNDNDRLESQPDSELMAVLERLGEAVERREEKLAKNPHNWTTEKLSGEVERLTNVIRIYKVDGEDTYELEERRTELERILASKLQ